MLGVDGVGGDCGREADKHPGLSARVGVLPLVGDSNDSCANVATTWFIEATGVFPSVCPTVSLSWLCPLLWFGSASDVDIVDEVEKSPLGTLRTGTGPRTASRLLGTLLSGDPDLFSELVFR